MTKTIAPAKTPGVAIARVLRSLGLKQGNDFRVRGEYKHGERVGTVAAVSGGAANQTVADNADRIEQLAAETGFQFHVSIYFTPSGTVWVWVANFGQRTRQTHFLSPSGRTENTAEAAPEPAEQPKPVIRATLGEPRPAFGQSEAAPEANPYAGYVTHAFDGRTWARTEEGNVWFHQRIVHGPCHTLRFYSGRVQPKGWYLSGPGIDGDGFTAGKLSEAVPRANFLLDQVAPLVTSMEQVIKDWPKGQRVQGPDNYGVTCMGTVNGVAWGAVTQMNHENYGRTWVDVDWDQYPHNQGTGRRSRPFTNSLIKH